MLKKLHRSLLLSLPLPFFAAFGTIMFLLLMQFLFRYLPDLAGRGLPFLVILELIAYSLAYMVTLAIPMAWLIAQLVAFGRFSESRGYAVAKSAGVPLLRLAWPVIAAGLFLAGAMVYFNSVTLPDASFRLNDLWTDIRVSRPGFALEPGVFSTAVEGYAIRADAIPADSNGLLEGVTVIENTGGGGNVIVKARRARLQTQGGGRRLTLLLDDGEVHIRKAQQRGDEGYEQLGFSRHRMTFELGDTGFQRSEGDTGPRTDRTIRSSDMVRIVDSLEATASTRLDAVRALLDPTPAETTPAQGDSLNALPEDTTVASLPPPTFATHREVLAGLPDSTRRNVYAFALDQANQALSGARSEIRSVEWERLRAARYRVEIYKKVSIALACLVFVLIGIPLGLSIHRAGVGIIATLAVVIFLFYWVTLVQGEKLADRGHLAPWIGMWAANVLIGLLGAYLFAREARDPAWRDPIRTFAHRFRPRD